MSAIDQARLRHGRYVLIRAGLNPSLQERTSWSLGGRRPWLYVEYGPTRHRSYAWDVLDLSEHGMRVVALEVRDLAVLDLIVRHQIAARRPLKVTNAGDRR